MLDPESRANEGLDGDADGEKDIDLISQLSDMKIGGDSEKEDKVLLLPLKRHHSVSGFYEG